MDIKPLSVDLLNLTIIVNQLDNRYLKKLFNLKYIIGQKEKIVYEAKMLAEEVLDSLNIV